MPTTPCEPLGTDPVTLPAQKGENTKKKGGEINMYVNVWSMSMFGVQYPVQIFGYGTHDNSSKKKKKKKLGT